MHYIIELVHDRTIILQYCPTDEQIADIFTKSFSEKKFTYLRSLLGVISSGWSNYFQCPAWGGGFPSGSSLFSSLRFIFEYCLSYIIVGALEFHALYVFTSPEYSLRGGVGDIYPPCTLNLVNLTLLNHYPKFYWLNRHQMSTLWHQHEHTHAYLQSRRPTKPSPSFEEANWSTPRVI